MRVKLATPEFEYVQWIGSNEAEIQSFVESQTGRSDYYTFRASEGTMFVGPYSFAVVETGGYVMFGPIYGTDTTQAGITGATKDQFAAQFDPA